MLFAELALYLLWFKELLGPCSYNCWTLNFALSLIITGLPKFILETERTIEGQRYNRTKPAFVF